LWYKGEYGDATVQADWKHGEPKNDSLVIQPYMLPKLTDGKKVVPKGKISPIMLEHLRREGLMAPAEWIDQYSKMFQHIMVTAAEVEAKEEVTPKKQRKHAPVPRPDEQLPVLLRRRQFSLSTIKTLDPNVQRTVLGMMLLGRPMSTAFDPFVVASPFDDVVEIPIAGRLHTYVHSEVEAESVKVKFRSPATRQLQVGDESLTYFSKVHHDKVAETISELRGMEKLIGTYYEHTEGGTGMVSLVHTNDSCIHHELIHNKTNTGRLASANPNCQNIPKEDKSPLREMFVSRFGQEGMCIEADYSQLEVITLAALAKDEQMIEDLRNNVDFHCKRVTMIRPDLGYDDVVLRAKKNKEPEFVKLRQQAKIFSFQRQYGAGVKMLSESTGLSQETIRQLIDKEREIYKGCDLFTNIVTLSANKYDPTLQDGTKNVRGHQIYKGMFPVITGSRYVFTESDLPESFQREKSEAEKSTNFSPTHLKNYPVQGFAGEIVQIMLGKLWRHFVANNNYNGDALLMNTVHDCVWVDTTKRAYLTVAQDVERIMSGAREELNRLWPEMECVVSFPVDVVAGENMCHLRPLPREKK
jgi:hypothetical protein